MKLSSAANDNLIERTRQVWQPRLQRDLGREDARQIVENITGFFNILAEWSQAEMPRSANDNVRPEVRGAESESALTRLLPAARGHACGMNLRTSVVKPSQIEA